MTLATTTVPLPAFWSSSGNQLSRRHWKEHLCQNPRCAANNAASTTPPKEHRAKTNRHPSKRYRSRNLFSICKKRISASPPGSDISFTRTKYHRCRNCDTDILLPSTEVLRPLSKGSTTMNSRGSTASVSSSRSCAPDLPTPIASATEPMRVSRESYPSQTRRLGTRSDGLRGISTRSQLSIPAASSTECANGYNGAESLAVNSPQEGRVAPPPSESFEEESSVEEREQQQNTPTPHFPESPTILPSTLHPTETSSSTTEFGISTTCATVAGDSTSPNWSFVLSATGRTEAAGPPVLSTVSRATKKSKNMDSHPSSFRPEILNIQSGNRTTKTRTVVRKNGLTDVSTGISTMISMATRGNSTQFGALEHGVQEDRRSTVSELSDATVHSNSPRENFPSEHSNGCGKKPISAFYNALYTPDCALRNPEVDIRLRTYRDVRKFRVALEIALLSVMVTLLVVVFLPLLSRGWNLDRCCTCSTPCPGTPRNPSQHYSQLRIYGSWVDRGTRNVLKCPHAQQPIASTVFK